MKSERQLGLVWGTVAVLLLALSSQAERLVSTLPACPIKAVSGLPCLTCGATRTGLALAQLDIVGAIALNPLAALAWVALIGGGLVAGVLALLGRPLREPDLRLSLPIRCALVMAVLANWVYLVGAGT